MQTVVFLLNGVTILELSTDGIFTDEIRETAGLLAYEHRCDVSDIIIKGGNENGNN